MHRPCTATHPCAKRFPRVVRPRTHVLPRTIRQPRPRPSAATQRRHAVRHHRAAHRRRLQHLHHAPRLRHHATTVLRSRRVPPTCDVWDQVAIAELKNLHDGMKRGLTAPFSCASQPPSVGLLDGDRPASEQPDDLCECNHNIEHWWAPNALQCPPGRRHHAGRVTRNVGFRPALQVALSNFSSARHPAMVCPGFPLFH